VATFIILLGGFGALARLGVMHGNLPGWVLVKIACWAVLAVLVAIPYPQARPGAQPSSGACRCSVAIAVVMAIYKPF
jgi:NADH:ubiquinone oxidoreductase subunit H